MRSESAWTRSGVSISNRGLPRSTRSPAFARSRRTCPVYGVKIEVVLSSLKAIRPGALFSSRKSRVSTVRTATCSSCGSLSCTVFGIFSRSVADGVAVAGAGPASLLQAAPSPATSTSASQSEKRMEIFIYRFPSNTRLSAHRCGVSGRIEPSLEHSGRRATRRVNGDAIPSPWTDRWRGAGGGHRLTESHGYLPIHDVDWLRRPGLDFPERGTVHPIDHQQRPDRWRARRRPEPTGPFGHGEDDVVPGLPRDHVEWLVPTWPSHRGMYVDVEPEQCQERDCDRCGDLGAGDLVSL